MKLPTLSTFPKLPRTAAYIVLDNPSKRNALSLTVLHDLKHQLEVALTSPVSGKLRLLPPFRQSILRELETAAAAKPSLPTTTTTTKAPSDYRWLVDAAEWRKERAGLPDVLVLRSSGPVFCSGHDLKEMEAMSHDEVKQLFSVCADVMSMLRRSPVPVVCPVHAFATAAGCQLALTADHTIALADTPFCLPGANLGFPCSSPVTAVSRRLPSAFSYRLLATAEPVPASSLQGAVDVVPVPEHAESTDTAAAAFEARVAHVVNMLSSKAAQPQALAKWAFWTQLGIRGSSEEEEGKLDAHGDGYEEAAHWAGRVMALHAKSEDAKEGKRAFFEKRSPEFISKSKM